MHSYCVRISSVRTPFIKQAPNAILFCAIVLVIWFVMRDKPVDIFLAFLLAIGLGVSYFLLKTNSARMVDAVYDCGHFLLVENGEQREKIEFKNVISLVPFKGSLINYNVIVAVFLKYETKLGDKFYFQRPFHIGLSKNYVHPAIKNVMDRLDMRQEQQRKMKEEEADFMKGKK